MANSTNAQLAALTKQMKLLVRIQTQRINAIQATIMCENCGANHSTLDCLSLASLEQINFVLYNTHQQYNPAIVRDFEIDEDNMNFGDFIAMHQANTARYDATFEIDEDDMNFRDFIAMHQANTTRYDETFEIDDDDLILGDIWKLSVTQNFCPYSYTFSSEVETNQLEHMPSITTMNEEQLSEILDNRPVIQPDEVPAKEEDYVKKEKLILNEQNKKVTFNDVALIKQFSNSRLSSKIDFVIKVDEKVEIFVVVFEQCAELPSYSCEERKFKFLRINENWCKVNRCKQSKSSKALFKVL
ncbi:hypothetical protein Adt_33595 [Abeliophyllum distichum]|uniref:Uncharacterized protein n=1 Tax=Abeliophyllum distichum TaxID=126358 RepID=A0ABD1QXM7_9LAMI